MCLIRKVISVVLAYIYHRDITELCEAHVQANMLPAVSTEDV